MFHCSIRKLSLHKDDRRKREKVDSKNTNDDDEVCRWAGLLHLFYGLSSKKSLKI